ncbi:hypothetical protein N7507_002524 [Penicillium longicatenatum]|nr:hypothetical protein N7507_002524 [Penicillium longicatenatum]
MTTTKSPDGPEDVNDFLLRIRELGERRDKEDDERTKRLEDEILQGRKERQARRAERARSIAGSPTLNPARLSVSSIGQSAIDPPEHLEPTVQTPDPEPLSGGKLSQESEPLYTTHSRRGSVQETEPESPRTVPALSRSRAGTLSWQQRPSSRDFANRSPGSTSPTRSSHLRNASMASNENRMSRASIAPSLSSKDPSWFRQTADRGLGSPAFLKSEERSESQADLGPSRQLPGMDQESPVEPEKVERVEEKSPSRPQTASTVGESNMSNRYSSVSSVSPNTGLGSPVAITETPKLDPSAQTETLADEPALPPSPTQRRMLPERARSTSPTKGLGGFVQSAMMRRSDSVSKRWSAQLPQGLSRSNSIVSNRNSVAAPSLTGSFSDMTPTTASRINRETGPVPTERPSSSHTEASVQPFETTDRPTTPSFSGNHETMRSEGSPSRPALYGHARSTSSVTADSFGGDGPSSPFTSRTMDPRRWSPTKSTWLESALNRPDSRQSKPPPPQPSWQQARQSRGSVDMGRASTFKEVTPVGLMRTPPPGGHFKKPSLSGTPSVLSSPTFTKKATVPDSPSSVLKSEPQPAQSIPEPEPPKAEVMEEPEVTEEEKEEKEEPKSSNVLDTEPEDSPEKPPVEELKNSPKPESIRKPPALSTKPNFSLPNREPLSPKPKPQSPVVDFRANLRKRDVAQDKEKQAEPEFKNIFGKLKKTETRNYVAPDELKDNILRGKSALNATGGPKKTPRVDEFRQSLVITKEAMKAGGGSIRRNTVGEEDAPAKPAEPIPEALAKRNLMTKTTNDRKSNPDIQSPTPAPELSPARSFRAQEAPLSPLTLGEATSPVAREQDFAEMEPKNSPSLDMDPKDVVETEKELSNEETRSVRSLPSPVGSETASMSTTTQVSAAKGKLAGRINPALAGLLSRGPPSPEATKKELSVPASMNASAALPSAPLIHATKGRARGPKRRAPKEASAPAVSPAEDIKEVGAISSPEVETSQTIPEPAVSLEAISDNTSAENVVVDTETAQIGSPYIKQFPGVKTTFQDVLNGGLQRLRSFSPTSPRESTVLSPIEHAPRESESSRDLSPSSRPPVPPKPSSPSPSPSPSSPSSSRFQWGQARFISSSPSPLRMSSREFQKELPSTPSPKNPQE